MVGPSTDIVARTGLSPWTKHGTGSAPFDIPDVRPDWVKKY